MKIVLALDSFKGSMSSIEAGEAAAEGIKRADPDIETVVRPLADGGEGTVDALVTGMGGRYEEVTVTGPLGEKVISRYGKIGDGTAVIEMSSAAGITLVPADKRNPMKTTTYGVGETIIDAIDKGCRKFIIGIGGSATNDGGAGMLQALGFEFNDEAGASIKYGAEGLRDLCSISSASAREELKECSFYIACDVKNPLCGEKGCSKIYGPQKGATPDMINDMDEWLGKYAQIAKEVFSDADPNIPGSGAAGGMGFAFRTFLGAILESGIDIVIRETRLVDFVKDADLVVTGEGMLDAQTAMGKAPIGVAHLAKSYNKPVIAFAGGVTEDARACNQEGIDAFFPIVRGVSTLEEAMNPEIAKNNLKDTAEQVMRLLMNIGRTI